MKTAIIGRWKIVEMDAWDLDFIDIEEPGYIAFKKGGPGQMHFGCVDLELDWRQDPDAERVDFSFVGRDEEDEVTGRGWAKMEGKKLIGWIVFHQGEESGFKACRQEKGK